MTDMSIFNELWIFDVLRYSDFGNASEFGLDQKLTSCGLLPARQLRHNRPARQARMDTPALPK